MVDRVGQDLERHFGESAYKGDEDLVFAHPVSGNALDASALRKRYTRARQAAGVRTVRFHDCATRSALGWRQPGSRCGRSRSGWDTATSRRR